jgi:hypothetical protein
MPSTDLSPVNVGQRKEPFDPVKPKERPYTVVESSPPERHMRTAVLGKNANPDFAGDDGKGRL